MLTLPIHAFGFAATFRLTDLAAALVGSEVVRDQDKDRLIARFGPVNGAPRLIFLYDFGAAVFVGFEAAACQAFVQALIARLPPEPHAPLTEEFLVDVRPGETAAVLFDRAVIPEASLPALDIICLLLAQSVVMDYYEEDVDEIIARTDKMTRALHATGRIPGRGRVLGQFIGNCMTTRNEIVESLALFDKPESTWDDPQLDHLYNALRIELEIDDRFRALEKRLAVIQDNLVLFLELQQARSSWRLEFIIVLLIVFEIFLSLWNMSQGAGH